MFGWGVILILLGSGMFVFPRIGWNAIYVSIFPEHLRPFVGGAAIALGVVLIVLKLRKKPAPEKK